MVLYEIGGHVAPRLALQGLVR